MSKEVRTIGIVGTGIIATSMAVLTTGHGFKTVVYARSEASAQRCRNDYENHWKSLVGHGLATSEQVDICKTYLVISQDYKAMADAEIVFESALENPDVKHDIYHILEDTCPDVKAICSVSSSIVPDILENFPGTGQRLISVLFAGSSGGDNRKHIKLLDMILVSIKPAGIQKLL